MAQRQEALRDLADELARRARQLDLNQTQVLAVVRDAFRATDAIPPAAAPSSVPKSAE